MNPINNFYSIHICTKAEGTGRNRSFKFTLVITVLVDIVIIQQQCIGLDFSIIISKVSYSF